jgi:iron complex outermembrane receptor protein
MAQTVSSAPPASVDELVVTATRVIREGFSAPTPTTVFGAEELQKTGGTNVGDLMRQIPAFQPTTTPTSTSLSSQNAGGNFLNLRNLGNSRTLVLVDGRRFVPTTSTGIVDTNVIPAALIERVDVVTGGASAAWGSDAVSGVVNLILKKDLQGLQGNVQVGQSQRGDNQSYQGSLAYGSQFADGRGHFEIAGEYEQNNGVLHQNRRGWSRDSFGIVTNTSYTPTNGQPQLLITPGFGLAVASEGGLIVSGVLKGTQFGPGGVPQPFNYGSNVGTFMSGGSGLNVGQLLPLEVPLKRANLYTRGSYDFGSVTGFIEASLANSESTANVTPQFDLGSITIQRDNAYLPAALRTQLTTAGQTSFLMGRVSTDFGFIVARNTNATGRLVAGFNGKLGGDWTWDASAGYGETRYSAQLRNNRISSRFTAAVDAVVDPATGQTVCRSSLTSPSNGCVPVNLFGVGSPSAAAIAYIGGTQALVSHISEKTAAANIQGEPFSTWAGPVSTAFGVEYRREELNQRVDALSLANAFLIGNEKPISGSYHVEEGFAETVIPLAHDLPLIKSLDFNGAVRVTRYSTSGSVVTWKAGLSYEVNDQLRLRGTRSRDIRAPNLSELFTQTVLRFGTVVNPANGQQATVRQVTSGNPSLKPEKADTTTLGVIYQPTWFTGLRASVDYFNIQIDGAIASISAQETINRCAAGNTALCDLVTRDATGTPTEIALRQINLSTLKTNGFDFELAYNTPLEAIVAKAPGDIALRFLATYTDKLTTNDGRTTVDRVGDVGTGNGGIPHWRVNLSQTYIVDSWSFYLGERYVGGGNYSNAFTPGQINKPHIASQFLVDTSVQYTVKGGPAKSLQLYANVRNLLDKDPPLDPANFVFPLYSNAVLYDTIGRTFSVGARFKY